MATGKSALGKALHYLLEQWTYLVHYLEANRLELSNNRAECSIKPFVIGDGQKNWLFANTPAGAQCSSVICSLLETARGTRWVRIANWFGLCRRRQNWYKGISLGQNTSSRVQHREL